MNERILIITSYPLRDSLYSKKVGGLASFAKNLINSIGNYNFTILAEKINGIESYSEGGNEIERIWERGSISLYPILIRELHNKRHTYKKLMVQFEFGIYGNEYITGLFPLVLIFGKLFGYEIILVQHQVIQNLNELSQHLGITRNSFGTRTKNLLTRLYLKLNALLSDKIVVFDEIHKIKLEQLTHTNKIVVIPHGVEHQNIATLDIEWPKGLTGGFDQEKFTIMTFGFVAWYKGTDWLTTEFNNYIKTHEESNLYQLLIAGGESPTQKDNPAYKEYYDTFTAGVNKAQGKIFHTGFVDEKDIPFYFMNSDLIILPYRVLMSSSGPLSLAMTYERPFLLSETLKPYTLTEDFQRILDEIGMSRESITFSMDDDSLFERIKSIHSDKQLYDKMVLLSKKLKEERSWARIGDQYEKLLASK